MRKLAARMISSFSGLHEHGRSHGCAFRRLHTVRRASSYRDFAVFAAARFFTTLSWQILGAAVGWQV